MSDTVTTNGPSLEVVSPDGSRRAVRITQWPFVMGRGGDTGNHLQLADPLISRQCAAIVSGNGRCHIEDRGNRQGIFSVTARKTERHALEEGDVISFGIEDSYKGIFHAATPQESIQGILTRIGTPYRRPFFLRKVSGSLIFCSRRRRFCTRSSCSIARALRHDRSCDLHYRRRSRIAAGSGTVRISSRSPRARCRGKQFADGKPGAQLRQTALRHVPWT